MNETVGVNCSVCFVLIILVGVARAILVVVLFDGDQNVVVDCAFFVLDGEKNALREFTVAVVVALSPADRGETAMVFVTIDKGIAVVVAIAKFVVDGAVAVVSVNTAVVIVDVAKTTKLVNK